MAILEDFLTDKAKQEWRWKLQCCREYKRLTRKVIEVNRLYISHFSYPVYTIEPVVKLVVQPVWQLAVSCKQLSNRLSNQLSNRFDNCVERTAIPSTGCQTGLYNRFDNRVERTATVRSTIQPVVKRVVRLSNRFDNRLNVCIYDTTGLIQPVVKPDQFGNRFDIWLCRVYKHLLGCQTRLTTGCVV